MEIKVTEPLRYPKDLGRVRVTRHSPGNPLLALYGPNILTLEGQEWRYRRKLEQKVSQFKKYRAGTFRDCSPSPPNDGFLDSKISGWESVNERAVPLGAFIDQCMGTNDESDLTHCL